MTPAQWLEEQIERAELMASAARPIDYFESGNGAMWLLAQMDGLRALSAACLAHHQPVLLVSAEDEP